LDGGFQVLNRDRVDLLMTSAFCCCLLALFIRPMFAQFNALAARSNGNQCFTLQRA
jgi:hypothetical protein